MRFIPTTLKIGAAVAALALSAGAALAGPTYSFALNQTAVSNLAGGVGTVTLTQDGNNSVDVLVDLNPAGSGATFGFINTGGPHTPFAFNLANMAGLSIVFTKPTGGTFTNAGSYTFALDTSGGSATPYGDFTGAIDITPVDNGSSHGYFGDLAFTLTRTGGLSTEDFIINDPTDKAYFAADISNGTNTGTVAATTRTLDPISVSEPTTFALLGAGLIGLGFARRRRA